MDLNHINHSIICGECESCPPSWDCKDCGEHYCDTCKDVVHSKGQRKKHTNFERIHPCQECSSHIAVRKCEDCKGKVYCERCFMATHNRTDGKYRRHKNFDVFGVKLQPFVDPDEKNGFGINVKTDLVCGGPTGRMQEWRADIDEIIKESTEAADASGETADGEPQHFTDVEILRMEGSATRRRTRGWRRLNKILMDDVFTEAQPTSASMSSPGGRSNSIMSGGSARSRMSITSGVSLISIDALMNSKWHKERKPHYLFERGNNTLISGSGKFAHLKDFRGVTALSKFLDYDMLNEEEFELAAGENDDAATATAAAADHEDTSAPIPVNVAEYTPNGKAFEVGTALLTLNGKALQQTIVSAEFYRQHGVMFNQLYDVEASKWKMLYVDDLFPCDGQGNLLFGLTEHSAETWKMFLTKAAAKFFGSMKHVEDSKDVIAMLRTLTGGLVTVDVWQPRRGDQLQFSKRGSVMQQQQQGGGGSTPPDAQQQEGGNANSSTNGNSDRKILKEYIWWFLKKVQQHNLMLICANSQEATVEEAHTEAKFGLDGVPSPVVAPITNISECIPDEVLPWSVLRRKQERAKKQQEVFYNSSLPSVESLGSPGAAASASFASSVPAHVELPNPIFDLATCGLPLVASELSSKEANRLGMRRESFVGDHALGLRLCKMRQFSNWLHQAAMESTMMNGGPGGDNQSIATSATMAGQRFKYHNSSHLWTKQLRDYFDLTVADDELTHATMEDIRANFNSFILCSDVAGSSRVLPVSLFPIAGPLRPGAPVDLRENPRVVKALVKLSSSAATSPCPGRRFLQCEGFDLTTGTEIVDEPQDQVDVSLYVPQVGIELGSLRKVNPNCSYAARIQLASERTLQEQEAAGQEAPPPGVSSSNWLHIPSTGVPKAPTVTPQRSRSAILRASSTSPAAGEAAAGTTTTKETEEEEDEIPLMSESLGLQNSHWLVLTVQARYPKANLKMFLNFDPSMVEKVILLQNKTGAEQ